MGSPASGTSTAGKAMKIALIATVAAIAAYTGYRAYKKQYPFDELLSKKARKEQQKGDNSTATTAEETLEVGSIQKAVEDEAQAIKEEAVEQHQLTPSELAAQARSEGNEHYARKNYDLAVECYTRSIQLYPSDNKDLALAYSNRAACYLHMGRFSAVIDDCTKALEISPEMIKALDRRSQANEHLNNMMDALVDATAICLIDNFTNSNFVARVEHLLRTMSMEKANEDFKTKELKLPSKWFMEEFFSVFPGEWDNVDTAKNDKYDNALDALANKRYHQAAELSILAVQEAEQDAIRKAKALSLAASFDILKGDIEAADAALKESLELNPNDPNVLIKQALVHLEKNDFIEMTHSLERSYNLNPTNPALFYHRGEVLALSGSLEAAVKDFEEAEKLCPNFEIAYVHHARGLIGLGREGEAEQVLVAALERFKNSVEIKNALGEVYVCKNDYRLAEKTFKSILSSHPKSPQVHLNLALLKMAESNDIKAAEVHLKRALEIDPSFEAAHLQMANLLISAERNDEAMKYFDKAIQHARSLQELTSVYSLKLASLVQLKCVERFPELKAKMTALMEEKRRH